MKWAAVLNYISCSYCKALTHLLEKSWRVFGLFSFSLIVVLQEIQDGADVARPLSTTQCNPSELPLWQEKNVRAHCDVSPDIIALCNAQILANLMKMASIRTLASIFCLCECFPPPYTKWDVSHFFARTCCGTFGCCPYGLEILITFFIVVLRAQFLVPCEVVYWLGENLQHSCSFKSSNRST